MVKILSRSGDSLADIYDVAGSIAGIEQLDTRELPIVHEMGATIFSERLSGTIRRAAAIDVIQNTDFNVVLTDLPRGITKIFGIQVFSDDQARISRVDVVIRDDLGARELPIWVWDGTSFENANFEDNGGGVATHALLVPAAGTQMLPSILIGAGQPGIVNQVALRGRTTGFGAGDVDIIMVMYIGFTQLGSVASSNRGLPVPSW